ncbi:MAG TPA: DUF4198 domain-containing protein [Gemmataceae bacterium]|jgi:uncharacterized GH25 family protein
MTKYLLSGLIVLALAAALPAHDTWVQTNTNVVRPGDNVHLDLMLGNHGNDHRDFKLAGKIDQEGCTLTVLAPDGKRYDLRDRLVDAGYTPKEGYWTTRFAAARPGLYLVAHTSDKVVSYAPTRSVKSAKTFFLVSKSLDNVPRDNPGFDKPLGHALELVPQASPVTPMGPGTPIKVKLLYKGKPLTGARVSFIPRGTTLNETFDPRYERKTDAEGRASFTPTEGNYYLVVAHHLEPKESGEKYKSTKYSATLTVLVPQVCPCCGE